VNVPRPYETEPGWEVIITTPAFKEGQRAAWRDFEKDPDSTPNRTLLCQLNSREFAAGYVDEWENFCVPMRAVQRARETPVLCPNEWVHDAMPCEDCDYLGE
jgi:hypothetical protein